MFGGEEIKINASSVEAISSNIASLYANGNIAINNSSLSALATSYSIYTPSGNIVITNSAVDCTAKIGTAAACNKLIITSSESVSFSGAKAALSAGAVELDDGYYLSDNVQLKVLQRAKYDVVFNVDGTEYSKQSVWHGDCVTTAGITAPSKEGKSFAGWTKEGESSLFDFDTPITENTALNASWTDLTYTVSFDSKGGSSVLSQTVKYNEKAIKPAEPTKVDNNFGGWYRDLTYKLLFDFDTQITTNTDLYASWSAIEKQKEDPTPTNLDPTPTNLDPTPTNLDPTPTNLDPTPTDLDPKPYFIPDNARIASETITTDTACKRDKTCPLSNFKDLDPLFWYHDGIHYCLEQKLMNGIGDDYFSPGGNTTRGMAMTILARMAGIEVDGTGAEWYKKGLDWAVSEGISDGTMPEEYITREQFATMLYRFAQKTGIGGPITSNILYSDSQNVSSWAAEAVQWCSMNGILDGYGDGSLRPQGLLTRAETAKMIQAFCEAIN